jgi:hypothetical protein
VINWTGGFANFTPMANPAPSLHTLVERKTADTKVSIPTELSRHRESLLAENFKVQLFFTTPQASRLQSATIREIS